MPDNDLEKLREEFSRLLQSEDRGKCVDFALTMLSSGKVSIPILYETIIAPSLDLSESVKDITGIAVWREHVWSSIVRTVIECCYPYVIKERGAHGKTGIGRVAVICPPDELHEIGARMASDFFTIVGFDVTFVGANTPLEDFLKVIGKLHPDYVAVSVTNYYSLSVLKNVIARIRDASDGNLTIAVGGSVFKTDPEMSRKIGADILLQTFHDIERLVEVKS